MKNRLQKVVAGVLILALGVLNFTACGTKETAKNTVKTTDADNTQETFHVDNVGEFTIRVGITSGEINQYLKVLDNHTGFLKDRGINFETTEFAAGINTIDAITTGQLDVGIFADYAGVNRIGNTVDVTDLRAFAQSAKTNALTLYVNPEVVKEPADVAGKTVISMAGVVYEYDWGKYFETYGIDPATVSVANVGSTQEALALVEKGDAVADWVSPADAPYFEKYGWEPFVSIGDIDATMYTFLVSSEAYLSTHKEEVAKYLAVSQEAFQYISDHIDEFAGWVETDLGISADYVKISWTSNEHEYSFRKDAYEDLNKVEKWCFANGNFKTDYDFADFINTDALELVFPDRVDWK